MNYEIKVAAIARSSELQFHSKILERRLQENLREFCRAECEFPGSCAKDVSFIKEHLNCISEEKYRGTVIHSRTQQHIIGKQPTKRALGAEKKYALSKEILSIEVANAVTSDKVEIEGAFLAYYRELFGQRIDILPSAELCRLFTRLPQLSGSDRVHLQEPITLDEAEASVDKFATHKSPGLDGISAEFYKHYKNIVCPLIFEYIQHAYRVQAFPATFLQAHAVLISKSEDANTLRLVTGYRPITLCNVDYEVYMRILTNCLQSVICGLICSHQTCGIRGRSIQTNTHVSRGVLVSYST